MSGRRRRRRRRSSSSASSARGEIAPIPEPAAPTHPLDRIIEGLLAITLAFCPFAYGAVEGWSQLIAFSLVTAIVVVFAIRMTTSSTYRMVSTWAYLPICLFLPLVAAHLVRLPAWLIHAISPQTLALRTRLLQDLPNASELLRTGAISFYPEGTRHDLRIVLAAAAVFVVVVNTFRQPNQIRRLLLIVLCIGAAVGVLALAQDLTQATHIFWTGPAGRGRATAGPFVSYSHFGQFMNLAIGAGIGLLLVEIHRNLPRSEDPGFASPKPVFHRTRRLGFFIGIFLAIGIVTVFLSGSRGAMIGLLIALGIGTATLSQTRGLEGKAWIALPIVILLAVGFLFFGPPSAFNRLDTLEDTHFFSDRLQILRDLTIEWKQFPLFGAGLGTHEVVYPMYDHSNHLETATHAENDFAQAMEETGIVGVVFVLMFVLLIWSHFARATRNSDPPIRLAGIGLGVGLLAVQIHSIADFGQHLPANALLSATVCGLMVAVSTQRRHSSRKSRSSESSSEDASAGTSSRSFSHQLESKNRQEAGADDDSPSNDASVQSFSYERSSRRSHPVGPFVMSMRVVAGVIALAVCYSQLREARAAYMAERHFVRATGMETSLASVSWDAGNDVYSELLNEASEACSLAPENVAYRYSLNAYRWHAISRVRDPYTGEIVAVDSTFRHARKICEDLGEARLLCPTYARLYLLAGQIELNLLNDPIGVRHIRLAHSLARNDQVAAGLAARCEADEGKWNESVRTYNRYLDLGGNFDPVMRAFVYDYHKPELALQLAKGNIDRLKGVAECLAKIDPPLAIQARNEAFAALRVQATLSDTPASVKADYAEQCIKRGLITDAIRAYRDASALDFSNVAYHLALGQLLASQDQFDEAAHELKRCLRLDPANQTARSVLGKILSGASATEPTTLPATQAPTPDNLSPSPQPASTQPGSTQTPPAGEPLKPSADSDQRARIRDRHD